MAEKIKHMYGIYIKGDDIKLLVNLVFDYYTDIIDVPNYIAYNIKDYQDKCDEWLFDESIDHQFWERDEFGKKDVVGICSEAFVYWLNEFILKNNDEKAVIVKRNLKKFDSSLPTLFY